MDWKLIIALLVMVTLSCIFGMIARDVMFAMGAASWAAKAFSKAELLRAGWDEDEEGFEIGTTAVPVVKDVRPALAWRALRRKAADAADLAEAATARARHAAKHAAPARLPYQRWLAHTDSVIARFDSQQAVPNA